MPSMEKTSFRVIPKGEHAQGPQGARGPRPATPQGDPGTVLSRLTDTAHAHVPQRRFQDTVTCALLPISLYFTVMSTFFLEASLSQAPKTTHRAVGRQETDGHGRLLQQPRPLARMAWGHQSHTLRARSNAEFFSSARNLRPAGS